ncbi:MAG TPA: hypothetical protein VLB27_04120, partial [candidate division Zixibacteria bacterium]|nr:hypothetical protein [candidate division Zixibacteria bacterium]
DAQMRGASHWLFARTLEGLIANGVRVIDLGAGPGGASSAGLDRFKSGWGADAETHTESVYRRRAWNRLTRLARR